VRLYDIDDLRRVADANLDHRRREAVRAEAIVAAEVRRFAGERPRLRAAA
jgi:glutamyl-tRNA reductase